MASWLFPQSSYGLCAFQPCARRWACRNGALSRDASSVPRAIRTTMAGTGQNSSTRFVMEWLRARLRNAWCYATGVSGWRLPREQPVDAQRIREAAIHRSAYGSGVLARSIMRRGRQSEGNRANVVMWPDSCSPAAAKGGRRGEHGGAVCDVASGGRDTRRSPWSYMDLVGVRKLGLSWGRD
jgi:hypothetical protein